MKKVLALCFFAVCSFAYAQPVSSSTTATTDTSNEKNSYDPYLKKRVSYLLTLMQSSSNAYHQVLDKANVDFTDVQTKIKYNDYNNKYISLTNRLTYENARLQEAVNGQSKDKVSEIEKRKSNVSDLVGQLDALLKEYDGWVKSL